MKKFNFAKISWVSAIFIGLIVILIAVMHYKIYYQYKTKNIIYFYDCDGTLCVTEVENDNHLLYSKYECGYDACPTFTTEIEDKYVILNKDDKSILFNYRSDLVISSNYQDYKLLNNNYLIVTKNNLKGIIDLNNNVIAPIIYQEIGIIKDDYLTGYNLNSIIAMKNDKYGIISLKDGSIIKEFEYEDSNLQDLLKDLNNEI